MDIKVDNFLIKYNILINTLKWILISIAIGIFSGTASAAFLKSLEYVTELREVNPYLLYLLPIGGLSVALLYHHWGKNVEAGNNLILDEIHSPSKILQLRMTPLVFLGTVVTHLFGGSAGREGSALQMGASLGDQLSRILKLPAHERKIILISGMAAGFGSVFGTPLAGAIFGLEVYLIGKLSYEAILPAFISAIVADEVTRNWWGITHSVYSISSVPEATIKNLLLAAAAGIFFGLAGELFSASITLVKKTIAKATTFKPYQAIIGGLAIILLTELLGTTKYNGLGLHVISEAFTNPVLPYDFILKIVFTAITLGVGYKGGEVTCLFFIGATLGNVLSIFIPLPMALLAGMGFVAVFAGASNTPIACTLMGIELFGTGTELYIAVACIVAYLFSGHTGIYSRQVIGKGKIDLYSQDEGARIGEI